MKLYLLTLLQNDATKDIPHCNIARGFIIRAKSPSAARKIASENSGDEQYETWIYPFKSKCEVLNPNGEQELILRDYNAG